MKGSIRFVLGLLFVLVAVSSMNIWVILPVATIGLILLQSGVLALTEST